MYIHTLTQSHIYIYTYTWSLTHTCSHIHKHAHPHIHRHKIIHKHIHSHTYHGCTDTLLSWSYTTFTRDAPRMSFVLGNTISLILFPRHCSVWWGLGMPKESGKELEKHPSQHVSIFFGLRSPFIIIILIIIGKFLLFPF